MLKNIRKTLNWKREYAIIINKVFYDSIKLHKMKTYGGVEVPLNVLLTAALYGGG
jgi:hypothetical protein